MSHVDRDRLTLRALGEALDAEERRHLEACDECREDLTGLEGIVEVARSVTDEDRARTPPPGRVWAAIVGELPEEASVTDGDELTSRRASTGPELWRRPATWLVTAAAVIAIAVGVVVLPGTDQGQVIATADLQRLEGVESGQARAELVTIDGERRLRLDVTGLPSRSDSYYEVWLLAPDVSRLVSLGPVRDDGTYAIPKAIDPGELPVVDISVEPTDGDPTHSGDSVLRGQLPIST